jgi:phage terminase large subunit-like protein
MRDVTNGSQNRADLQKLGANLAGSFFASIVRRYEGTRLGRQELDAEYLEDIEGALWSRSLIEELTSTRAPAAKKISRPAMFARRPKFTRTYLKIED